MRTTLTLDEDVAKLLQKEVRRSGEPMKQAVNRLLRSGLIHSESAQQIKPFKVRPFAMGLPKEWTSGCTQELLEMLESDEQK